MRRITLLITEAERQALDALAQRALRQPRDQLRVILVEEAQRQGLLRARETFSNSCEEGGSRAYGSNNGRA